MQKNKILGITTLLEDLTEYKLIFNNFRKFE